MLFYTFFYTKFSGSNTYLGRFLYFTSHAYAQAQKQKGGEARSDAGRQGKRGTSVCPTTCLFRNQSGLRSFHSLTAQYLTHFENSHRSSLCAETPSKWQTHTLRWLIVLSKTRSTSSMLTIPLLQLAEYGHIPLLHLYNHPY